MDQKENEILLEVEDVEGLPEDYCRMIGTTIILDCTRDYEVTAIGSWESGELRHLSEEQLKELCRYDIYVSPILENQPRILLEAGIPVFGVCTKKAIERIK